MREKQQARSANVRPPKVTFGRRTLHGFGCRRWSGQPPIKGPKVGERRVFSPPLAARGEPKPSHVDFDEFLVFLQIVQSFEGFYVCFEGFKQKSKVWKFGALEAWFFITPR